MFYKAQDPEFQCLTSFTMPPPGKTCILSLRCKFNKQASERYTRCHSNQCLIHQKNLRSSLRVPLVHLTSSTPSVALWTEAVQLQHEVKSHRRKGGSVRMQPVQLGYAPGCISALKTGVPCTESNVRVHCQKVKLTMSWLYFIQYSVIYYQSSSFINQAHAEETMYNSKITIIWQMWYLYIFIKFKKSSWLLLFL